MGESVSSISIGELRSLIGGRHCSIIIDVRRPQTYDAADTVIPTACWRDLRAVDAWIECLPDDADIVVYCAHGREMSQAAAAALRARGRRARHLAGGIEAYRQEGGPLVLRGVPSNRADGALGRWITRERPKIDRIACPWLIRRFIDRDAAFFFVPADVVVEAARELEAVPYDIPGVAFSHEGELCSFDAFLTRFCRVDPALDRLATIVRGADTARLDLAPQAAGLLAMSLGLSAIHPNDHTMLEHGMTLYDALYAWARSAVAETHGWPPA